MRTRQRGALERREAPSDVAEHAETLARKVVQLDLGVDVNEVGVAVGRVGEPVADAGAELPVGREVVADFAFELIAPARAAVDNVGRGAEVAAEIVAVL